MSKKFESIVFSVGIHELRLCSDHVSAGPSDHRGIRTIACFLPRENPRKHERAVCTITQFVMKQEVIRTFYTKAKLLRDVERSRIFPSRCSVQHGKKNQALDAWYVYHALVARGWYSTIEHSASSAPFDALPIDHHTKNLIISPIRVLASIVTFPIESSSLNMAFTAFCTALCPEKADSKRWGDGRTRLSSELRVISLLSHLIPIL